MRAWKRASAVMVVAAAGLGAAVSGCGSRTDSTGGSSATLNLTSLPAAEVWVDGSSRGSTPVVVAVSQGRHEVVMRQTGFDDFRQSLDVQGGAPQTIDATLLATDAENPEALRKLAAAFDVAVEPITAPSLHRGAVGGDVVLMFPRNDVRREGLTTWRVDVTPSYGGDGTLEWRAGKSVLAKQAFNPTTLVSVGEVPKSVVEAAKVGLTVTWGIYYPDRRKAVTAQFEVVSKPQAAKKLAEIDADKRLAQQPVELRDQLRAEVLQNYRLYSEALATYLDLKAKSKDSVLPHGGIVSCLRRMDLEGTALYAESASKVTGKLRRGDTSGGIALTRPGVGQTPPGAPTPPTAPPAQPPTPGATPPTAPPAQPPTPDATPPTAPPAQPPTPDATPPTPAAPPVPGTPPTPGAPPAPETPPTPAAPPAPETPPAPAAPPAPETPPTPGARPIPVTPPAPPAPPAPDAPKDRSAPTAPGAPKQPDAAPDPASPETPPAPPASPAQPQSPMDAAKAAATAKDLARKQQEARRAADAALRAAAARAGQADGPALAKAAHDAEMAAERAAHEAAAAATEASKAAATASERAQQMLTDARDAADAAAKAAADHAGQPDAARFTRAANEAAEHLRRAERAAAAAAKAAADAPPPTDAK